MVETVSPHRFEKLRVNYLRLTFVLLLPLIIFSSSELYLPHWLIEVLENFGLLLVIVGVLGRFWSILYIGGRKSQMIMQDGPYSVCRHPLYLFSTIAVVGFGLMLSSVVMTALIGGLTFLILNHTASKEEAKLRAAFGPAYDDYAARVPRIWPKLSLFTTEDEISFKVGELRRNLMDALVFLCFIPLAELAKELQENGLVPTFPIW